MAQTQNLLLQSQTFDNASWSKTNCTITADNTTAPDGTATADRINDDGTNGRHDVSQTWSTTPAGWIRTLTFSMYAKAGVSSWVQMNNSDVTALTAYFNLSTGAVGTVGTSISEAKMTAAANGFYLCQITFTVSATTSSVILHAGIASADATPSYAGGTGTLFFWGAQFVLADYVPAYSATTTVGVNVGTGLRKRAFPLQNLLTQSNDFSQSVWNAVVGTITKTANSLDWAAEGGAGDSIIRHVLSPTKYIAGTQFTFSAEIQWVSGASILYCDVNDKVGNIYGDPMTISTDGVRRRYSVVLTCGNGAGGLDLSPKINSGTPSPAMKINIWNAQLTFGNNLGEIAVAVAAATGVNAPRNIPVQAQNLMIQSQTLNTGSFSQNNLTVTADQIAAPDGTTTADLMTTAVDGSSQTHYIRYNGLTNLKGSVYTESCYFKAGTKSTVALGWISSGVYVIFDLANGVVGTNTLGAGNYGFIQSVGNGWYRCWITYLWPNLPSASVGAALVITSSASVVAYQSAGGETVYAWGWQQVQGDQVGPYQVTTTAAVNIGALRNQPKKAQNLILQSETFGTTWSTVSCSVSSNATTAPDGTLTADKIVEASSGATQHRLDQLFVGVAVPYTFSVYAKAAERTAVELRMSSGVDVSFELSTATVLGISNSGIGYGISSVGNGWYRCWVSGISAAGASENCRINLSGPGGTTYAGDGTSGLYVWGACLTKAINNPGNYNSTVRTTTVAVDNGNLRNNPVCFQNLLLQSQTMDNASWTKTRATISANAATAPDGTATADTLIEDGTAGNTHLMTQTITVTPADIGKFFCASVFVKAASGTRRLSLSLSDNTTGDAGCVFDPATGIILLGGLSAGSWTNIGYNVSPCGNGWYKVSAFGRLGASTTSLLIRCLLDNGTSTSYNGDSTSGLNLWGAGISRGTNPGVYTPTTTAAVNAGSFRNQI